MIDHTGIGVPKNLYEKTRDFYVKALEPLGYKVIIEIPGGGGVGLGTDKANVDFWIVGTDEKGKVFENGKGNHWAFRADTHAQVDSFHAGALATGATCNGPAGPRERYSPLYYGAFVFDPVGNNVEVCCRNLEEAAKKGVVLPAADAA